MRLISYMTFAAIAFASAAPVQAGESTYYPYPTDTNYCPDELQPIVYGAEISCGTPNTQTSWDSVIRHPRGVAYRVPRAPLVCPEGQKGC